MYLNEVGNKSFTLAGFQMNQWGNDGSCFFIQIILKNL